MGFQCAAPKCAIGTALQVKGVPLCPRHYDQVKRRVIAQGTTLEDFNGNVRELLSERRPIGLGGLLADESRLARSALARARKRLRAITEIQDTRRQLRFLQAQWAAFSRDSVAHKRVDQVQTLARLDKRIEELELRLAQLNRALRAI